MNLTQTFISLIKDKILLYFRLKHIQINQTYVNLNYVNLSYENLTYVNIFPKFTYFTLTGEPRFTYYPSAKNSILKKEMGIFFCFICLFMQYFYRIYPTSVTEPYRTVSNRHFSKITVLLKVTFFAHRFMQRYIEK